MKKCAQVFCNIVDHGFFNINQGKHQAVFSGIFSIFINVPALLHIEGKRHLIRIAHIAQHLDVLFAFKKLCIGCQIVQPYVDF